MTNALDEVLAIRADNGGVADMPTISNADPVLPTRFKIAETCAAVTAGIGLAVTDIWQQRSGRRQAVEVDVRHAAAALGSTTHMQRVGSNGRWESIVSAEHKAMRQITQPWPTKDGRWFLPHFGLPNLRERVLNVLGCEPTPESVSRAVAQWDALELEAAIDSVRACGAMVRSNAEWLSSAHGRALTAKPIVEIIKIADSEPELFAPAERPLSGLKVLDLTRILAGPIAARTLAEHGADVLMVTAQGLPQISEHVLDTSHGKRSCFLDLRDQTDMRSLRQLIQQADVFSQGYRPGALASLGLGPEQLAELRPGIIYTSISCFGADGPLSHRAGWEQVAQTVTGICNDGGVDRPALLPAAACDYTTGYLAAYGVLLALARRARDGGSYHVRVSLCQSGMLIYRQGKTASVATDLALSELELDQIRTESDTSHGRLRHLRPIVQLSETNPHWLRPTPTLGTDAAQWL